MFRFAEHKILDRPNELIEFSFLLNCDTKEEMIVNVTLAGLLCALLRQMNARVVGSRCELPSMTRMSRIAASFF